MYSGNTFRPTGAFSLVCTPGVRYSRFMMNRRPVRSAHVPPALTLVPAPAPRADRVWSAYQLAIFNDAAEGTGHTVVQARAGTGKTTVICEALRHVPAGLSILVVAFNNKIKDELLRRQKAGELPAHVEIKTCHGFGFGACMSAFRSRLVDGRTWDIIESQHGDGAEGRDFRAALGKAVSFAKGTLAETPGALGAMLENMLDAGQIEPAWLNTDAFVRDILAVLRECRDKPQAIDFDDICCLPAILPSSGSACANTTAFSWMRPRASARHRSSWRLPRASRAVGSARSAMTVRRSTPSAAPMSTRSTR